jgi:hypothetical protein
MDYFLAASMQRAHLPLILLMFFPHMQMLGLLIFPPRAQADIKEETDQIVESIEDLRKEEQHIFPSPELDEGNDDVEEDDAVENQGQHDPEGQMPGQLPAAVTQAEEGRTYAQCIGESKGPHSSALRAGGEDSSMQPIYQVAGS